MTRDPKAPRSGCSQRAACGAGSPHTHALAHTRSRHRPPPWPRRSRPPLAAHALIIGVTLSLGLAGCGVLPASRRADAPGHAGPLLTIRGELDNAIATLEHQKQRATPPDPGLWKSRVLDPEEGAQTEYASYAESTQAFPDPGVEFDLDFDVGRGSEDVDAAQSGYDPGYRKRGRLGRMVAEIEDHLRAMNERGRGAATDASKELTLRVLTSEIHPMLGQLVASAARLRRKARREMRRYTRFSWRDVDVDTHIGLSSGGFRSASVTGELKVGRGWEIFVEGKVRADDDGEPRGFDMIEVNRRLPGLSRDDASDGSSIEFGLRKKF